MIKNDNINKYILFFIIFLTSSFAVCNDIISSSLTIILWILLMALLIFQLKTINKGQLIVASLALLCIWTSVIINKENEMTAIKISFSFVCVFIYSNVVNFEKFKKDYIDVMKFICIVSLLGFFVFSIVKPLQNSFIRQSLSKDNYSCLYLYVHSCNYFRNCGLFWEPGAFQTFIGLALLLESTSKNPSKKNIIFFIITMVTTFSTTGYFVLMFIVLLNFNRRNAEQSIKIYLAVVVIITILFVFFNKDLFFSKSTSTAFGKILNYAEQSNKNESKNRYTSTSIRINSIIYPFLEFTKHPLFGCGYNGLNSSTYFYTKNMNTCTFVNWFAVYGIVFGYMMLKGYVKIAKKLSKSKKEFLIILVAVLISIISENYVNNAFIFLIALFGNKTETLRKNMEE